MTPALKVAADSGARTRANDADPVRLVEALKAENVRAEAQFYDQYAAHIGRVLTRILGPTPEVPDLLQETFIRAFKSLPKLREPQSLKPWLSGIAVYVAREHIKKSRRSRVEFVDPSELPETASGPSLDDGLQPSIYAILNGMSPDLRIVLALKWLDERSIPDVARWLKISESTAKRRLKKAEQIFMSRARDVPELSQWLEAGE